MRFEDIRGQSVLITSLQYAINEDKVANGYIFCGPKGCGKKLTALTFSAALNCRSSNGDKPCGVCSSCIKSRSGNHPNIEVVKPSGASIKIKQIRDLISNVSKTSFENGYKIVIIDNAEKMTQEAQDAFLKTLEEPPANTVFLLLVENYNVLLSTIVSRCQVFPLRRLSNKEVRDYLLNNVQCDEKYIKLATVCSNGIIGRAVHIIQDNVYFTTRNIYIHILENIFNNNFCELVALTSNHIVSRDDAELFLEFLLGWFRDVLLFSEVSDNTEDIITNADQHELLSKYCKRINGRDINNIIKFVKETIKCINHNVSIKNSIDGMLLNIMEVSNGKYSRDKI